MKWVLDLVLVTATKLVAAESLKEKFIPKNLR